MKLNGVAHLIYCNIIECMSDVSPIHRSKEQRREKSAIYPI